MGGEVTVDAVVRSVNFPADEPLGERRVPLEDVRPFREPSQLFFGQFAPEFLRLFGGVPVEFAITFEASYVGVLYKLWTWRIHRLGHIGSMLPDSSVYKSRRK
jgi:hypothetical protein